MRHADLLSGYAAAAAAAALLAGYTRLTWCSALLSWWKQRRLTAFLTYEMRATGQVRCAVALWLGSKSLPSCAGLPMLLLKVQRVLACL
jgi:hypothetical protein